MKTLSIQEALQAAHVIYEINTEPNGVLKLAQHAKILNMPHTDKSLFSSCEDAFLWEWRAFTHGAVLYGLMEHAPAGVVVEYIKNIQQILLMHGYDESLVIRFIDEPFNGYMEHIVDNTVKVCPEVFFKRFYGVSIQNADVTQVQIISGAMAMLFAACMDAFEKYEYALV